MAGARAKFKIGGDVQGVLVTRVDPDSPAADKNIRPGDVIVEVQSQAVKTPDDVAKRVDADAKAGKKVELMLVNRGGDLHLCGAEAELSEGVMGILVICSYRPKPGHEDEARRLMQAMCRCCAAMA